jgi:hypothetical protein
MLLKTLFCCESTDILHYAVRRKMANWNELHNIIWNLESEDKHRHFWYNSCVITSNFFKKSYQDDAYGLEWDEKLQKIVKAFMRFHKVKQMLVLNGKNHNCCIL